MLTRLIPKIFYAEIEDGLELFVRCLGFKMLHQDDKLVVVETDAIQSLYDEISAACPSILHPNAKSVERKPWGALEFAVRDETQVCVIFRQW
jgi:hypothetical protein